MRDWLKAFRPASFRGVRFEVDNDGAGGGRRLAVSPVAYSDRHVTEDMGGRDRRFQVTAYVAGDAADASARRLTGALQARGAATLVMPMLGPISAFVATWWMSREKSRAGYVAFDVEFVAAGSAGPSFAAVPGALQILDRMAGAASLFSTAAALVMRDAGPVQDQPVSSSARTASASLGLIASATVSDADQLAKIDSLTRQITVIADKPAGLAASISSLIAVAAFTIVERGNPALALDRLHAAIATGDDPAALTASGVFSAGFCHGLCAIEHGSRQDARTARSRIAPVTGPVIERLGVAGFSDAAEWLSGIAAIAADDLSATAANRAPLIRIETGQSLPATALAYALYGDAGRASELVSRNRVATPAVMPVILEAVAI